MTPSYMIEQWTRQFLVMEGADEFRQQNDRLGRAHYICIKLDEQSSEKLRGLASRAFGNRVKKTFCDHLTLAYGPQVDSFDNSLLGSKVELRSDRIVYDEKAAALPIGKRQVSQLGCRNEHPHITMATFDGTTKPVYSNELLKKLSDGDSDVHTIQLDEEVALNGTVSEEC